MGTNVLQIYEAITELLDARQHPKVITADQEILDPQQASNALALHFKLVFGTGHRLLRSRTNASHRINDPEVPSIRMRDIENIMKLKYKECSWTRRAATKDYEESPPNATGDVC
jgi:hypothetical protein